MVVVILSVRRSKLLAVLVIVALMVDPTCDVFPMVVPGCDALRGELSREGPNLVSKQAKGGFRLFITSTCRRTLSCFSFW